MSQKTLKITGLVLTIILGLLFTMSAFMKLTQNEEAVAQALKIGFSVSTYQMIGIIEVISLILFIIPRTGIIGALLLMAYMGGAIATHLQHQDSIVMPVIIEILIWIATFARYPELIKQISPANNK